MAVLPAGPQGPLPRAPAENAHKKSELKLKLY